jgi:hypothetical protein
MKLIILLITAFIFISTNLFGTVAIVNGLTHVNSGAAGDVLSGEVVLINSSAQEQRVVFEINEAVFSCSENRAFTPKNPHQQSSSNWFDGELMDKVMAPGEKYTYRYTITVPDDKSLYGSYWTVLMVSIEDPINEELLNSHIGLDTKIRYGVGIVTHIGQSGNVDLAFDSVDLKNTDTLSKNLKIKLKNEGQFMEGVELSLEVYDNNGNKVTEITTDRNMVFPGTCRDYLLDVSSLSPGEYQCILLAGSREEFVGANLSLSIK